MKKNIIKVTNIIYYFNLLIVIFLKNTQYPTFCICVCKYRKWG